MSPHNYYSHLSTFISVSLCGVLPNVPEIINGYLKMPLGPGWGTAIVEEVARAHP